MDDWSHDGTVLLEPPLIEEALTPLQRLRHEQYHEAGGMFRIDTYDWSTFNPEKFGWQRLDLTQGYFVIVSLRDFARVRSLGKWQANIQRHPRTGETLHIYARHNLSGGLTEYLHRFIPKVGRGVIVDHRNGLTLDCRYENLVATVQSLNMANSAPRGRVVHLDLPQGVEKRGKQFGWVMKIRGKNVRSRDKFPTPEEAHKAYLSQKSVHFSHNGYEGPIRFEVPLFPEKIRFRDDDIPF